MLVFLSVPGYRRSFVGLVVGVTGSTLDSNAAVADGDGRILAACRGGRLSLQEMTLVDFHRNLQGVVTRALSMASGSTGISVPNSTVYCSIEGILTQYDADRVKDFFG